MKKWIDEKSVPLVWEFTQQIAPKIFQSKLKVHFLYFIDEADSQIAKSAIKPLAKVSEKYNDKMVFVSINAADKTNAQILDFFGLKKENLPTYAIFEVLTSFREVIISRFCKAVISALYETIKNRIEPRSHISN